MQPKPRKLNKSQKEAVNHSKGPLLIVAGAGTGKTTVITQRIKHLIQTNRAKPSEILALTFTEKAAQEMEERVDMAMPMGYTQMWISTFHSFCDQILRESGHHIGIDTGYKLMTQAQTLFFIKNNLFEFNLKYFRPLGNPSKFLYGLLTHFSRLADEDISAKDYLKWAKKQKGTSKAEKLEKEKWLELARSYSTYEKLKIKESLFDFADLITKTITLFEKRPNVLSEYQNKFKHILIDEFQDTNYAQNKLATMIAGKKANITVVADDDQSIYRFRGAAVSNVLEFRKKYKKSKLISLTQNYRSYQEILDAAYSSIQFNNPDRLEVAENIDKKLVAQKSKGGEVLFLHTENSENEAEKVVGEIEKLTKKDYNFGDIAILVRANNHADTFVRSLERNGIPHQFLGPEKLLQREEIVNLISYIKVINNFEDSVSLSRVLAIRELNIPAKDLTRLGNSMRKTQNSLYQTISNAEDILDDTFSINSLIDLKKLIDKHIEESKTKPAGSILLEFLNEVGIYKNLIEPDNQEAELVAQNLAKFFEKLKSQETSSGDGSVSATVTWLDLASELGDSPLASELDHTSIDSVKLLTVHSAKGLEFPVVFIANLVGERFPTRRRGEQIPVPEDLIKETLPKGDFHLEEERRLFYVAATRAKDKLYLTAADYYGEAKRKKKLSPFIFEALGEESTHAEQSNVTPPFKNLKSPKQPAIKQATSNLHIDYLSYSQIQTFKICPLHYNLKYILKIPTPISHAQSFGISIHETMNKIYLEAKIGTKINEKNALKILKNNWLTEGYENKIHEREAFKKAKTYISDYLGNHFKPRKLPISLEKPFVVPLYKSNQRLKLGGKIDRIDKISGGIEIIDYKTGENIPTQNQADKDMQLSFYALAASKITEKPLGLEPENIRLSLFYFEGGQKISTIRTKKDLENLEKEVFELKKQIEESNFKCSGHPFCNNCEYSIYCKSTSN